MKDLEKSLGKALTAKELAEYLGVSEKAIRENYQQLGGVRIGRHYRFFERRILNALEKRQEQIYRSGKTSKSAQGTCVFHPEGSEGLGKQDAQDVGRGVVRHDRHGLLD
jgi:excisionase family DNA binding protein